MEDMDSNKNITSQKMLFCGEVGESLFNLIPAYFSREINLHEWSQFRGKEIIITHQARVAIAIVCLLWDVKEGDHILAPSYNCGSEIDPLFNTGASVEFYQVNTKGQYIVDDILRRVTSKTKLIYITHYFGWPQKIQAIMSWATAKNIKVIEDCALSLFSGCGTNPIGLQADAAIYSFPKSLPVPDGGALVIKKNQYFQDVLESPSIRDVFKKTLPLLKRNFLRNIDSSCLFPPLFNLLQKKQKTVLGLNYKISSAIPDNYYFVKHKRKWKQSKLGQGLLNRVDPQKIINKRRQNYTNLLEQIVKKSEIQPVFPDLPVYVCPLAFPIITRKRDEMCFKLNQQGISAIPWWAGYHRSISINEFTDACYLKNNVLVLPIHQDLNDKHIEYIADCVKRLL